MSLIFAARARRELNQRINPGKVLQAHKSRLHKLPRLAIIREAVKAH